jgi:hypothetical protein
MTKKKTKKRKRPKKKQAKKPAKPPIEKPEIETTPWPRAGDNKEFEEILAAEQPEIKPQAQAAEPGAPEETILNVKDVAEWVKWPFALWSTTQGLPAIIRENEALEIADPLTRIMNRHGVGGVIPPDVVDGLQIAGRTLPVIKRGHDMVQLERQRRTKAGQAKDGTGSQGSNKPAPQGAPAGKPIER